MNQISRVKTTPIVPWSLPSEMIAAEMIAAEKYTAENQKKAVVPA